MKRVAEELLAILKHDKLVLDWRKEQNTRAAVRVAVEETLDRLPEKFTRPIYAQKCDVVYQHVFDSLLGRRPLRLRPRGVSSDRRFLSSSPSPSQRQPGAPTKIARAGDPGRHRCC